MTKEPSPYFIKRNTPPPEDQPILLDDYMVEEQPGADLWDYWLTIRRHRWLILICALLCTLAVGLYTFTRIPIYTAHTVLLIERRPPQVLKMQDAAESVQYFYYDGEFYKTQYEILKSRALAAQAIQDDGLESQRPFAGEKSGLELKKGLLDKLWADVKAWRGRLFPAPPKANDSDPPGVKPGVIGAYLSMLQIKPIQGTSLVRVAFSTPDPALSARLANAHAAAYVRYGLNLRSKANEGALEFLEQKLLELKERVEKSEAALNSYRRDRGIISLTDKENLVVDRLVDLNKRLTAAEADRIGLEVQVRGIRRGSYNAVPAIINSGVIEGLKGELGKMEVEYAQLSKEFKPGYPRLENLKLRMEETRSRLMNEIQTEVKRIEAAYAAGKSREDELRARMEEQKKATLNLKDSAVQYAVLAREVDTNRQLYDSVLQRIKEVGVASDLRASNVYVVDESEPPLSPSYPNKKRSLLFGLLMGLVGGLGLAFLLERLDSTFRSSEEVEGYLHLPNLTIVPDFARVNHQGYSYVSRVLSHAEQDGPANPSTYPGKDIVLSHHPLSVVVEAYRTLRSSLLLSKAGEPPQTVLITSATRGEGKTATAVNTAIVFAQMGIRVLIVDADLRRPHCHKLLELENGVGLAELLAGQIDLERAIRPTATPNVFLISGGATPPDPAELLGSKKMHETLNTLRKGYEFIFIDSSPVMAVSDPVLLSAMVDGVILVVDGHKTPKQLVRKVRSRLSHSGTKILGVLLNRVDTRKGAYAYYYRDYYSYYGAEQDPEEKTA